MRERKVDVAIIGAGTAGLYALSQVKRAGKSFALIDQGPLGTTCARVGCMPSKVALHAGDLWASRDQAAAYGVSGIEGLEIDRQAAWAKVKAMRDGFAGGAAKGAAHSGGDHLIMGKARFILPNLLEVQTKTGLVQVWAKAVIIAVGSRPVVPKFLDDYKDHIITTDEFFEMNTLPDRLGVLGLGAIGLEMGLAASRMGVQVFGADMADTVAGIRDPEVAKIALEALGGEFPMALGAPAHLEAAEKGVDLVAGDRRVNVDKVLVALGRRSNVDRLNMEGAGFKVDARGIPFYDPHSLQVQGYPVYLVGDANGDRTLMHEAAHEGMVAGYNAGNGVNQAFERKPTFAVAFSNPDIVSVGAAYDSLDPETILIGTASTLSNGRSRIITNKSGLLRIYADKETGQVLGGAMVGAKAEHIGQFLALAVSQKATVHQLLAAPYYHPVVEEVIQSALEDLAKQVSLPAYPLGLVPLD